MVSHNTTSELIIGQQNIYYFTAEIYSRDAFDGFAGLYVNDTQIPSIPESPFCDQVVREKIFLQDSSVRMNCFTRVALTTNELESSLNT